MKEDDRQAERRLEALLGRAESLRRRLPFEDLRELAHLYRLSSARLAVHRSRAADPEAIRYLNALCVRAFTVLQVPEHRTYDVRRFFLTEFPATLGATAWLQALALGLLIAGGLVGAMIVSENPVALYTCVPARMYPPSTLDRLVNSPEQRIAFLTRRSADFGIKSIFSAGLFVQNTQVGFLAFASGILAGVPTVLLLLYNGLTLGAFAWIFSRDSNWPLFWAWLLPHAIPELLAVSLCSAGGLLIGMAVVAPGRRGVGVSLRAAAGMALELVGASLPLFVAAAGIESFLRQSTLSTPSRFAAAFGALAMISGYAFYVVRLARRRPPVDLGWLVTGGPLDGSRDIGSTPTG